MAVAAAVIVLNYGKSNYIVVPHEEWVINIVFSCIIYKTMPT